jgi:hypothetical protein
MNMSHFGAQSSLLAFAAALALGAAACASQPTPPPVAAAPPSQAFTQAAGGVTAPQGNPEDGVQFVETEHKEMQVHDQQGAPATGLKMEQSAKPKGL